MKTERRLNALLFLALVPLGCGKKEPVPAPTPPTASSASAQPAPKPAQPDPAPEPAPDPAPDPAYVPIDLSALPESPYAAQVARAQALLPSAPAEAITVLQGATSPAAAWVRAVALRQTGKPEAAEEQLRKAGEDPLLAEWVALEKGRLALALQRPAEAAQALNPLLDGTPAVRRMAVTPLIEALGEADPATLVQRRQAIEAALDPKNIDARSAWLAALEGAHRKLGQPDAAQAVALERYLQEPVSPLTPAEPPVGVQLTAQQRLQRAEALLQAHRNDRVVEEISRIATEALSPQERCRLEFGVGLAHRKLHNYANAEKHLTYVTGHCQDEDLVRRAMYINAKVISIRAGLRAVATIEEFAKRFAGHSMVDDVLFWAGDLYQRRGRYAEAEGYYERIQSLPDKGDHCADARWRMAWIAYRQKRLPQATERLQRVFLDDGCAPESFDRARAHYWLGRIAIQQSQQDAARAAFERAVELTPLGYYGQLSLKRLVELDPASEAQWQAKLQAPEGEGVPSLCPGWLAKDPRFAQALAFLDRGLRDQAKEALLALELGEQQVVAKSHAASQGIAPVEAEQREQVQAAGCGEGDAALLVALLLDRAGAHREGHWRLRTEFAEALERIPTARDIGLFKAAYPLAFREELAAAEKESQIPHMFLQALSREESAFDAEVVSWAGAYGLTQLLLRTGKRAGKLLDPPVEITHEQQLLEPALNARLGGAFLGELLRRMKGNPALALVSYNASESFANTLWKRHLNDDFDQFAEDITIRETRGYVKRVLKTFGIYLWLYEKQVPILPVGMRLPPRN